MVPSNDKTKKLIKPTSIKDLRLSIANTKVTVLSSGNIIALAKITAPPFIMIMVTMLNKTRDTIELANTDKETPTIPSLIAKG